MIADKHFANRIRLIMCHSCDMDGPRRNDTRWDSPDFIGIF
jgi:hypothetical protein